MKMDVKPYHFKLDDCRINVSTLLSKCKYIKDHSILHHLNIIYKGHGFTKQVPSNDDNSSSGDEEEEEEDYCSDTPNYSLPSMGYYRFYTIMGIDSIHFDKLIQCVLPDFSMTNILMLFCHHHHLSLYRTFPSMRYEISNLRPVGGARYHNNNKKENLSKNEYVVYRERYYHDNVDDDDDDDRNLVITKWANSDSDNDGEDDNDRKNNKKRRIHKITYSRIIPIMLLPLILKLLPKCYQESNNTLINCFKLHKELEHFIRFESKHPDYV
jgi:hypothetical protein